MRNTLSISSPSHWKDLAPNDIPECQEALHQRLNQAHLSQQICANEDYPRSLKNLLQFGLTVEVIPHGSSSKSSVPLAQYIADKLLNFNMNRKTQESIPYEFKLQLGNSSITIPNRSRLLFQHLSDDLRVSIFLFSSRASSIAWTPADAKYSIGFFHRVDSYLSISEYLILIPSKTHMLCPAPSIQPSAAHDSTPSAIFRMDGRHRTKRIREDVETLTRDYCQSILKRVW
jgi:hypothetical protein